MNESWVLMPNIKKEFNWFPENMERLFMYDKWRSREVLEDYRIIPYGIPNEIYYTILHHQFWPIGKGTLFPEHAEFAK